MPAGLLAVINRYGVAAAAYGDGGEHGHDEGRGEPPWVHERVGEVTVGQLGVAQGAGVRVATA